MLAQISALPHDVVYICGNHILRMSENHPDRVFVSHSNEREVGDYLLVIHKDSVLASGVFMSEC